MWDAAALPSPPARRRYAKGIESASSDYNVSPGQPNTAWRVPVTQADCNLEYTAVGGGPSGFGILASDLANKTVVYHASTPRRPGSTRRWRR